MACQLDKKIENTPKTGNEKKVICLNDYAVDTIPVYLADDSVLHDIDWGTVESDAVVEAYFAVENNTDNLVSIQRMRTGDGGCYVNYGSKTVSSVVIHPRKTVIIDIVQLTKSRYGRVNRRIEILWITFIDEELVNKKRSFRFGGFVNKKNDDE